MPKGKINYTAELHYREAARWAGYNWSEFLALEDFQQAGVIAHYETIHRIEAVEAHEQYKEAQRKAKRKR